MISNLDSTADFNAIESPQNLSDHLFSLGAALAVAAATLDLPPMCVMEVGPTFVKACAWCPKRLGDPEMMKRCQRWAKIRKLEVTHGMCEVCKKQYFPELKP